MEVDREVGERVVTHGRLRPLLGLVLFGSGGVWLWCAAATALAAPADLWTRCDNGNPASMFHCSQPRGIAANSDNGHIFVGEQGSRRVDEFNAIGQFLRTWGREVNKTKVESGTATEEEENLCPVDPGDECKAGVSGTGAGEFNIPVGIAVDSSGDVFVSDFSGRRVEKFTPKGQFLRTWGREVNKTKVESGTATEEEENLCPVDPGDECKAGVSGSGPGQFGSWGLGDVIAAGPADDIYVGGFERVQRFDAEGAYQDECSVPGRVQSLETDSAGKLYVAYVSTQGVRKLNYLAGGECEETLRFDIPEPDAFTHPKPIAVAVDGEGHVYAFSDEDSGSSFIPIDRIYEFDSTAALVDRWGKDEFSISTGMAANRCADSAAPGNLYVSNSVIGTASGPPKSAEAFVRAYGTDPIGCFKARTGQATELAKESMRLNGTVIPAGLEVSECRFEYGVGSGYGNEVPCVPGAAAISEGADPVDVHADIGGLAEGTVYHFRLVAKVSEEFETGADEEAKTLGPPVISADRALAVTESEARLGSEVNPEGFATSYHFEYLSEVQFQADGGSFAAAHSTPVIAIGSKREDRAVAANARGLEPGTEYRWRIVAANSSGTTQGVSHAFTTYRPFAVQGECPNRVLRTGSSAFLPDCRAYELVSPLDKNGGDVVVPGDEGGYTRSAPDGDKLTYTATAAFAGADQASFNNQYLARREARGWSNEGIHPPVAGEGIGLAFGLVREFMAFTPDLCWAWMAIYQTPPPTPDGQPGHPNLYRRANCEPGARSLEALVPAPPAIEGLRDDYAGNTSVQGVSADGGQALFVVRAPLPVTQAPAASSATKVGGFPIAQTYNRHDHGISLVSVLPNGLANPSDSALGSNWAFNLQHAVSRDGRAFWTADISNNGQGKIYQRRNPAEAASVQLHGSAAGAGDLLKGSMEVKNVATESGAFAAGQTIAATGIPFGTKIEDVSGSTLILSAAATHNASGAPLEAFSECTEAAKACTVPVSDSTASFFWAASPNGRRALFTEPNLLSGKLDLFLFEEGVKTRKLAEKAVGVVATGENLSKVYFVSSGKLGKEKNERGEEAIEGSPNLYLVDDEGTLGFIGTLSEYDVGKSEPGTTEIPYSLSSTNARVRAARANADGTRLAFQSRAPLTGYDNAVEGGSGGAVEVFLYDADSRELRCVSCKPSGASPTTGELFAPYEKSKINTPITKVQAAAWIPPWQQSNYASNVLSTDGNRLFFNSYDDLVPRDTNGAQDVYEWERAGAGSCTADSPSYFPQNGGCLYLISSGESPADSEFWEASPDGTDVFFSTASSLASYLEDPGLIDIYDARVGGGFPRPEEVFACEGEACQSPPPAPEAKTPASNAYDGPGNLAASPFARCTRAARRAKGLSRSAKRLRRASRRAAGKSRGAEARRTAKLARRQARKARRQGGAAKRCRRRARADRRASR